MKKLSIKNIIDFSRKTYRGKKTLINNLKIIKKPSLSGGGDYWISSTSAMGNAFKNNDNQLINEKIDHLLEEHEITPYKITRDMYQRNIRILKNYKDFDFSEWQPSNDIVFLPKPRAKSILSVKSLPIQV